MIDAYELRLKARTKTTNALRDARADGLSGTLTIIRLLYDADWHPLYAAESCREVAIDAALARKRRHVTQLLRLRAAWEALHDDALDVAEALLR
jgi:hypothetical protein